MADSFALGNIFVDISACLHISVVIFSHEVISQWCILISKQVDSFFASSSFFHLAVELLEGQADLPFFQEERST